jgi:SHS2 domain-containing protein
MISHSSGYCEIEHAADWELQVWAPSLASLLEQAARGMYALTGAELQEGAHQIRIIELSASDPESLLVSFLSELLYLSEQENLGFYSYNLEINGSALKAELHGAPLIQLNKEIKAITYHNMVISKTNRGLEVNIVFDV